MARFVKKKLWVLLGAIIAIILILFFLFRGKEHTRQEIRRAPDDTIRVSVGGEPTSLDPSISNGTWEVKIIANLFEGLITRNSEGSLAPGVATRWQTSNNGTVYTFYLRKDAKWSDGVPVTAHDFVFSIKRILHPKSDSTYTSLLYVIKGGDLYNSGKGNEDVVAVRALDDYTLQIELEHAANYFPELVSHSSFLPLPRHIVLKHGKTWAHPSNIVSNGPYKVVFWKSGNYIEAIRNPYYWDSKNVKIDKVVFYVQTDNDTLFKKYRANEIDILPNLNIDNYIWATNNIRDQLKVFPYMSTYYYSFNLENDKFQDPRVRLALNMSVDREFIIKKVLKTIQVSATYNFIPPGVKGYKYRVPEWAMWSMEQRVEEAIKLLNEAGYNSNNPLSFTISYNTLHSHKQVAMAIATMWRRLGVKTTLINKDIATHYKDLVAGNFEVGRCSWVGDYADPSAFLFIFTPSSKHNYARFRNLTYYNEYIAGLYASNSKTSMLHYQNAEHILLNSNIIIPIYHYIAKTLVKPRVQGFKPNFVDLHLIRYMTLSRE